MSDVNQAATLSMKIDTSSAAAELASLREAYGLLKKELAQGVGGVQGASQLVQAMKTSQAEVTALQNKVAQAAERNGQVMIAYSADLEQGRVSAKKVAENVTSDQVIEMSKQQRNAKNHADEMARVSSKAVLKDQAAATLEEARRNLSARESLYSNEYVATARSDQNLLALKARTRAQLKAEQEMEAQDRAKALAKQKDHADEMARVSSKAVLKDQAAATLEEARRNLSARESLYSNEYVATARSDQNLLALKARTRAQLKAEQEMEAQDRAKALAKQKADADVAAAIEASRINNIKLNSKFGQSTPVNRLRQAQSAGALLDAGYGEAALKTYGSSAVEASQSLTKLEEAINSTAVAKRRMGEAAKQATAAQHDINKAMNEGHALARGLSGSLGTLWVTYGSLAPLLAGAAIGAAAKGAISMGAEFERQMTFVRALGGETLTTTEAISAKLLETGRNSMFGPKEMASGMRLLAQAGLAANEAIQVLPSVLNLATVGEMDMETATKGLVGMMSTFNIEVANSARISDVLSKAAAESQTDVKGITEGMKYASAAATRFNIGIEETATYLTLFAKSNLTGSMSGTAFANMLKEIYTPSTDKAKKALADLKIKIYEDGKRVPLLDILEQLRKKFESLNEPSRDALSEMLTNERGARGLAAIFRSSRDEIDALNNRLKESGGFAAKAKDQIQNDFKGAFETLGNSLQTALIKASADIEPSVVDIANKLKGMVNSPEFATGVSAMLKGLVGLTGFVVDHGKQLLTVLEVYAGFKVLGAVAVGINAVATAWVGLNAAGAVTLLNAPRVTAAIGVMTNPFVLLAAAIASVSVAWDELKKRTNETEGGLQAQISKLKAEEANITSRTQMGGSTPAMQSRLKEVQTAREKMEQELSTMRNLSAAKSHDEQAAKNRRLLGGFDDNPAVVKAKDKAVDGTGTWKAGGKPERGMSAYAIENDRISSALKRIKEEAKGAVAAYDEIYAVGIIRIDEFAKAKAAVEQASLDRQIAFLEQEKKTITDKGHVQKVENDTAELRTQKLTLEQTARVELIKTYRAEKLARLDLAQASTDAAALADQEIELIGKTTIEQERLNLAYKAAIEFRNRTRNADGTPKLTQQGEDELKATMDANLSRDQDTAQRRYDASRTFEAGWAKALASYRENATNSAQMAADAFQTATSAMEQGLLQFTTTGKIAYKDLAQSVLKSLAQIAAKQAAMGLMNLAVSMVGAYFGGAGSGYGQTSSQAAVGADINSAGLGGFARGGVFSDSASLSRYSNGVYNSPQVFAFAKGAGIFAEAGPEAIMPLARNSQGVLGVRTTGGGETGDSSGINIEINITMDSSGNAKETTSGDEASSAKRLAEVIANVTKKVLVEEMRSGGMLNSLATR